MSALGRLSVLLSLNSAEFTKGLNDSERSALLTMRNIEQAVEAARVGFAAFAGAGLAVSAVLANLANQSSQYQDVAEKIGDSAANVASLKTAADVAGFSLDSMSGLVNKLSASLAKSDDDGKGAREAIKLLGIDLKAFEQLKSVDRIEGLARAFAGLEDSPQKSALAIAALGKSGAEALPFFNDLVEVGRSQYQVTEEQIAASNLFTEQLAKLKSEVNQLGQVTAGDLSPAMSGLLALLDSSLKYFRENEQGVNLLQTAMGGLTNILQVVLVVGSDVAFVFKGVVREVGGIAAQLVALSRGDITGFNAISDAMKADAAKARLELDKFQSSLFKPAASAQLYGGEARLGRTGVKRAAPGLLSATKAGGGGKSGKDPVAEFKREADELAKVIDSLSAKSSGFSSGFFKQFDTLSDAYDKGKLSLTEFNRLQAVLLSQQPGMEAAKSKEIELARVRNAEFDVEFEKIERDQSAIEVRIRSGRQMFESIDFETNLIGLSNLERQKAIALRDLENAGVKKGTEAYSEYAAKISGALETQEKTQAAQKNFESLSSGIVQALRGQGDGIKGFVDQALNEFLRLQVVGPLLKSLFGGLGGGGGGGGGDFLGQLGSFAASFISFEGGGSTGNGPRSGGLDGKGGYMALVHPKEQITDLTKGSDAGSSPTIIINNTIGSVASMDDVVRGMAATRSQIRADFSRNNRFGGAAA
jgi:hypothetical protein